MEEREPGGAEKRVIRFASPLQFRKRGLSSGILEKVFSIGDAELAGEEFGEEGVAKVG